MSIAILTPKQAFATIKLIAAAGKLLDERIHQVGIAGLHQYLHDKNTDVLNALVLAMPKSARGNSLKFWITQHANLQWSKTSGQEGTGGYKKNGNSEKEGNIEGRWADIQAASEKPFYEKADTEAHDYNAVARASAFFKTFESKFLEGKVSFEDAHKIYDSMQDGFQKLFAKEQAAAPTVQ